MREILKPIVIFIFLACKKPDHSTNSRQCYKSEKLNIVVSGIAATVGKNGNGRFQFENMGAYPGYDPVPELLVSNIEYFIQPWNV